MAAPVQHQEQYGAPPPQQYGAPEQNAFVPQDGAAPANGAAPVAPAKSGPIDNADIELWKQKFNRALADPSATINAKSGVEAREYESSFFGCCNPIDQCKFFLASVRFYESDGGTDCLRK